MKKQNTQKKIVKKEAAALSKKEWLAKFFGKFKGDFGDGVVYQRKLRDA